MTNEKLVTKWLEENTTGLSWTRVGNDTPAVKLDRLYINRSEAYEIRDFIIKFFDEFNISHSAQNYKVTFEKIMAFNKGQKVSSEDMLNHLAQFVQNSSSTN